MKKITIDASIHLDKQQIVLLLDEEHKKNNFPPVWEDILTDVAKALENHLGLPKEETQ